MVFVKYQISIAGRVGGWRMSTLALLRRCTIANLFALVRRRLGNGAPRTPRGNAGSGAFPGHGQPRGAAPTGIGLEGGGRCAGEGGRDESRPYGCASGSTRFSSSSGTRFFISSPPILTSDNYAMNRAPTARRRRDCGMRTNPARESAKADFVLLLPRVHSPGPTPAPPPPPRRAGGRWWRGPGSRRRRGCRRIGCSGRRIRAG